MLNQLGCSEPQTKYRRIQILILKREREEEEEEERRPTLDSLDQITREDQNVFPNSISCWLRQTAIMDVIIIIYVSLTQKQYNLNLTLKHRKSNRLKTLPIMMTTVQWGQLIKFKVGLYNNSKYSVLNCTAMCCIFLQNYQLSL